MDFNVLFDTGKGLLSKWETYLNNLISFLCNDNHVKDKSIKAYLQILKEELLIFPESKLYHFVRNFRNLE